MLYCDGQGTDGRDVPPELTGKTHRLGDAPSVLLVLLLLDLGKNVKNFRDFWGIFEIFGQILKFLIKIT